MSIVCKYRIRKIYNIFVFPTPNKKSLNSLIGLTINVIIFLLSS